MPTFENGWICRKCWTANREFDSQCYRCKTPRPDYSTVPEIQPMAKPAPAPTQAPIPQGVVLAAAHAPAQDPEPLHETEYRACTNCGEALLEGASFCTRCGTSVSGQPQRRTTVAAAAPLPEEVAVPARLIAQPAAAAQTPPDVDATPKGPRVSMPRVSMPQVSVPRVSLPRPSAAGIGAWMRRLPPVAFVTAVVGGVAHGVQRVVSFRPRRSEVWLFTSWVVLLVVSSVALFSYAGGQGDFGGELVRGLVVVVLLCVLSALTAALTTVLVGPRRATLAEMSERLRAMSEQPSAPSGYVPSQRPERPDLVPPMLTPQGARRAS